LILITLERHKMHDQKDGRDCCNIGLLAQKLRMTYTCSNAILSEYTLHKTRCW